MMDETAALQSILDEHDEAWCAGDAVAFSRSTALDIVFTNVVGLFSVGREPFEAQHGHIVANFYKGSSLRQLVERISFVRPDVAVVNTLTKVTDFGALPPFFWHRRSPHDPARTSFRAHGRALAGCGFP